MNVEQKDLDLWRRFLEQLRVTMLEGAEGASTGKPGSRQAVRALMLDTASAAARMGVRLEQAGAARPPELPAPPETPLRLLDTPANRRYLDALRVAYDAGLAVDRERYGEAIGSDGEAQIIEMLLVDKQMEIFGPARDESRVG